uniref:peptidyl-prolyl cis-trans isomerase n=2 Tax=Yoonia sp. TaxID=2212373 RepID=UPI004048B5C9
MATKRKNRYFLWIIMGLLTIGLLGFGTGGLNGNIRNIGTVGAKDIPVAQYQRGLRDQMQSFSGQLGRAVGFQEAQAIGLDQAVLAQLVTERTLDNEAATLGISIGDERVREELLLVPAFRGSTGAFDREAYRFTLQQVGLSEAEFETSVREEIARTMLQGAVVSGIPAPDAYASALSQFIGEARAITWAPVTASDLSSPPAAATDAQLQTYYSENPAAFTAPEARQISYVWLTPDMIQDQLDIDQTALQDLYQERISEFVQPERRLVERLIYLDTAAAQAAKDSLGDTVDFDALVAARGLAMSEVDMGDVTRDDLGSNGDAIFSASPGDVIGPLDTFLGPALFRMNAVLASQTVTFEEAEPDLREELSSARARRLIDSSRAQIEDLLAGGAQLEDLAQQTDLAFGTITWTDQVQDDIAAYEEFRAAAAAITQDAYPSLMDLADGGIFALRLDDITPPALIPFEQVRDAVRAGYDAQVLQAAIVAQAQDIAATILPLTGFETLGLSANTQRAATRRSFINGTPADFMTQVFKMDVGDVNVIDTDAGAIIVRLDGIAAADANDPQVAAQKQAASDQAISGISQDIFDAFANAVQNRTDVVIDQAAVNAVNAQLQ